MVTISPATQFASVTRVLSGHSATFSRTVTASPGPQDRAYNSMGYISPT